MSWATLTDQITSLVSSNASTLGIQEVKGYPTLNFTGYPAISLFPSDNENDYETTSENERIYAWKLMCVYETKVTGLDSAFDALYDIVDGVMDLLDKENELQSGKTIGVSMPARYTFINIFATPNLFGNTEDENLIFGELTVRIRVSYDAYP